jgi:hypothetical protein
MKRSEWKRTVFLIGFLWINFPVAGGWIMVTLRQLFALGFNASVSFFFCVMRRKRRKKNEEMGSNLIKWTMDRFLACNNVRVHLSFHLQLLIDSDPSFCSCWPSAGKQMIRLLARSISLVLVVVAGYFICRHGLAANFLFLFDSLSPTFLSFHRSMVSGKSYD